MSVNSLTAWTRAVRSSWRAPGKDLIEDCRRYLERLALTPTTEDWLAALRQGGLDSQELYRDLEHGFILLVHGESEGLYRPPHDHGRSWVIYAVLQGEVEMGTYAPGHDGGLVKHSSTRMTAGQAQVYLPGDVHDTLCVSGPALLLRFTERDLQVEKQEGRMTRYARRGGAWLAEAA